MAVRGERGPGLPGGGDQLLPRSLTPSPRRRRSDGEEFFDCEDGEEELSPQSPEVAPRRPVGVLRFEQCRAAQETAPSTGDPSCLTRCFNSTSEAFKMVMLFLLIVVIVVLLLPAMPILGLVTGLACLFMKLCSFFGDTWHEWAADAANAFIYGASTPQEVSEAVCREVSGRSEALRGSGFRRNLAYKIRHEHPILGIFFCESNHPYSPFERLGTLFVLSTYSYLAALATAMHLHEFLMPEDAPWWELKLRNLALSTVVVTVPTLVLDSVLSSLALGDFCMGLEEHMRGLAQVRQITFLKKLLARHQLLQAKAPPESTWLGRAAQIGAGVAVAALAIANPALAIAVAAGAALKAAEGPLARCQLSLKRWSKQLVGGYFGALAWTASITLLIIAMRIDDARAAELSHEAVWETFISGLGLSYLLAIPKTALEFGLKWRYQHWQRAPFQVKCCFCSGCRCRRRTIVFPPAPEDEQELYSALFGQDPSPNHYALQGQLEKIVNIATQDLRPDAAQQLLPLLREAAGSSDAWAQVLAAFLQDYRVIAGWTHESSC